MHLHYLSLTLLLQGEYTYIPKRKRWKRMNQAWSLFTWLTLCAFNWANLMTTQMKVPKKRRSPPKSRRRWNNIYKLLREDND